MLGIFYLAESSKWLVDKNDVGRNAGKDKPQRRGKAINATNTSMECFILLWFRNDCGVMAGRAHSNLGIHARLWRWCICWLELSGRSGQQLNQFERQKNALTVNPARAVNRKIGHWWLKSIGNSSAKLFHGKQFHDDKIIARDKCFNVIDPWASIYNLLIPTKAVSQEFMVIDWSKKGENKLLIGSEPAAHSHFHLAGPSVERTGLDHAGLRGFLSGFFDRPLICKHWICTHTLVSTSLYLKKKSKFWRKGCFYCRSRTSNMPGLHKFFHPAIPDG